MNRSKISLPALLSLVLIGDNLFAQKTTPTPDSNGSGKYLHLESYSKALNIIESQYVDPEKSRADRLIEQSIAGMLENLDPHTKYFNAERMRSFLESTKGTAFGGIGITLVRTKKALIIQKVIKSSPADKAGLMAGDELIAIDGVKAEDHNLERLSKSLRGEPGSKVEVTWQRKSPSGPPKVLSATLYRDVIKPQSLYSLNIDSKTHYLRIFSFHDSIFQEVKSYLSEITAQQNTHPRLILDLRDNPGGLLDQAIKICDLFIDSGLIVTTRGRDQTSVEREFARKRGTLKHFPVVVIVNGGTASAAEILAGALQDHRRALILGETTFGKGSVQTLISLPNGAGLKVTIARYYTPNDRSIQAKGIRPDIYISPLPPQPSTSKRPKEADLKGHLSTDKNLTKKATKPTDQLPKPLSEDYQVLTAYKYLMGSEIINSSRASFKAF